MTNPKTVPAILYTPNAHKAAIGILSTNINGEEVLAVISVNKKSGTSVYEYKFDGGIISGLKRSVSNGITRVEANDIWKIAAENYGAVLSQVDNKFMRSNFKEILKPYELKLKEERKLAREHKVLMEKIRTGEETGECKVSLFD